MISGLKKLGVSVCLVMTGASGMAFAQARNPPIPSGVYDFAQYDRALRDLSDKDVETAAARGAPWAEFGMGVYCERGKGRPVDYAKAVEWYQKAADAGFAPAIMHLAAMYRSGTHVGMDVDKAIALYTILADKGDADAQYLLGVIYQVPTPGDPKGEGRVDLDQAKRWYILAASQGSQPASFNLAVIYDKTDPAQAIILLRRLTQTDSGSDVYIAAANRLADKLYHGDGVTVDFVDCARLSDIAALLGNGASQNRLATQYYQGQGVPQDDVTAYAWFRIAADAHDPDGIDNYNATRPQITAGQRPLVEAKITDLKIQSATASAVHAELATKVTAQKK